jgi:hypothetical protein
MAALDHSQRPNNDGVGARVDAILLKWDLNGDGCMASSELKTVLRCIAVNADLSELERKAAMTVRRTTVAI